MLYHIRQNQFAVQQVRDPSMQTSGNRKEPNPVNSIAAISLSTVAQLEERKAKLELYQTEYNDVQSRLELLDDPAIETVSRKYSMLLSAKFTDIFRQYDEWFPFFNTFNSVIHSNTSLSNTQRFQYLRASLTGDASAVVSSLELSDANYDVAWSIHKERYDNKRVIVQTHVSAIFDLPTMTRENVVELRRLSSVTKHLHALQTLKRPTMHWDDLLVHLLTSKFDSLTRVTNLISEQQAAIA
ncbi:PREDICTED: uncharacterized protein LOC108692704 [Atta colombica]|uniref:uncharacterized protein LOC108692704 n=1 Tax=Atta colombica TaxID=520822 RepID=UPI00084C4194|nr:PREDICTED: uncharacterized protein LOC108692704 [Atta colombica]